MASTSALNRFVETFVGPLVMGGRVQVQGLLGPGILQSWQRDASLDGTLIAKITRVMHDRLAKLGSVGSADRLPEDFLALAAVWHNVLAMTHPEARGRSGLRRRVRTWCDTFLAWAGAPQTRAEVALRHGLLCRLADVGRVDTHVAFWAGYADFLGVAPPRTLVALPRLRRVREEKSRVGFYDLLKGLEPASPDEADIDLHAVVRAALAASPLTDLSLAERPAPLTFGWTPSTVNAVADPCLRGAAQRSILARGTPAVRAVETATLESIRARTLPPTAALALARFHVEMLAMDALSARSGQSAVAQPLAMDAYARLGAERAGALTGLSPDLLARVLPIDTSRPVPKDPPSAPLLVTAGLLEVRP